MYGLKQGPISWHSHIDSYFTQNRFQRNESEPTLYIKADQKGNMLIVCLCGDAFIFTAEFGIEEFMPVMKDELKSLI